MKPKSKFQSPRPAIALAITFVLSQVPQAHAADGIWTAYYSPYYETSQPWSSPASWSGGIIGDGVDSTATFSNYSGYYDTGITLDSARSIGHLVFGNPRTDPRSWSLAGSNPANILTLGVSSGSPTITVNSNTHASIRASINGTNGLTKAGSGSLYLSGANSYTGETVINTGSLQFSNPQSLYNGDAAQWTAANISVASGATLAVNIGSYFNKSLPGLSTAFTIAQTKTLLSNLTTSINHDGLRAGSTFAIDTSHAGGSMTFDQVIADSTGPGGGALGFTKIDSYNGNTLVLNQANTYTGPTTVSGGILAISGAGTLGQNAALVVNGYGQLDLGGTTQTVGSVIANDSGYSRGAITNGNLIGTSYEITGNQTISAGLGGVGANFSKTGPGTGILSGANTYSGTTTISSGTLQLAKASALYNGSDPSWTKEKISVASGATLSVNVGGINDFTVAQTRTLLSNLSTSINNNGLQAGANFGIDTTNATGDTTFDQVIADSTGTGAGALGFTKLGTRKLIFNQVNTYTGTTTIAAGSLAISGSGTLGNHADLSVSSSDLDLGGTTQTVGAVGFDYAWVSNGNLIATSYNLRGGNISAGLGGEGANLNKTAGFMTLLSGTNTYTGTTTVSAGTLKFAKTAALYNSNTASWTKENISVSSGATLEVNLGGSGEFSVAQSKTLLTNLTTSVDNNGLKAGSTFAIDTTNATGATTFDQAITDSTGTGAGSLGFTKLGTGTLILNQANTYTGPTRIDGGTLKISDSGTFGNQGDLIIDGGYLDLGGSTQTVGAVQSHGFISSGNLIATSYNLRGGNISAGLGGEGANLYLTNQSYSYLEGVNTYTGTTTIDRSILGLRKSVSLYNADISKWTKENISAFNSSYYLSGIIVSLGGVGEFTAAQAKTLLSNLTTSINHNGLTAGTSFGFDTSNSSGPVIFDQVIADSTGNGAGTLNLIVEGAQALVLNQANTYSGNTSLIGGHLKVGHANAIPSGAGKGVVTTQLWTAGDSKIDLNGFDISINALSGDNAMIFNGAIGTHSKITLGSNDPAYPWWFSGQITDNSGTGGTLSLNKIGSSTQALSGDNTYTGATTVSSGTLVVNGSISASTLTTVESGATLGGSGSVGSLRAETGGTVAPGTSIGSLHSGSVTFANNSTYQYEVDSSAVLAAGADLLMIQGDLDLDMTQLAFGNIAAAPESFQVGTLFSLLNYTGSWNGGLFVLGSNILEDGEQFFAGQNFWSIDYDAATGGLNFSENQFVSSSSRFINITATAVPEPSSILLGAAAFLLLLRRRR